MDVLHASNNLSHWREEYNNTMEDDETLPRQSVNGSLSSPRLLALLQCPVCHDLLSRPVTLPCGQSVCYNCLPEPHERLLVSYPDDASRRIGVRCPFRDCGLEHCCADINRDFVLQGVIEGIVQHSGRDDDYTRQSRPFAPDTRKFSSEGDVAQDSVSTEGLSNNGLLRRLIPELTCLVCHTLFASPVTTGCGHTFCRQCLLQTTLSLPSCPICRHTLPPPLSISSQNTNQMISELLQFLDPAAATISSLPTPEVFEADALIKDVPTFVCALSFPMMPTYLHIFEPRYRLMLAQVLQQSPPMFGMVGYHQSRNLEEKSLALSQFGCVATGTMLEVISVQMTRDGRSVVELAGRWRFGIERASYHADGYLVSEIRRLDDISVPEEEAAEIADRSVHILQEEVVELSEKMSPVLPADAVSVASSGSTSSEERPPRTVRPSVKPIEEISVISSLPTSELFMRCTTFIAQMQTTSAPWLRRNVITSVGNMPEDPTRFTWWFASVMPVSEAEKYRILRLRSVRDRLKVCVEWIVKARQQVGGYGRIGGNSAASDMCATM